MLQRDGRIVAVIVPETSEMSPGADIRRAIREAAEEGSKRLPSYQRISDYTPLAANLFSSRVSASSSGTSWRNATKGPGEAKKARPRSKCPRHVS